MLLVAMDHHKCLQLLAANYFNHCEYISRNKPPGVVQVRQYCVVYCNVVQYTSWNTILKSKKF